MTQPTPEMLKLAESIADQAHKDRAAFGWQYAYDAALAAIRRTTELAEQLARSREEIRVRLYKQNEAATNAHRASEAFDIAEAIRVGNHLKGQSDE